MKVGLRVSQAPAQTLWKPVVVFSALGVCALGMGSVVFARWLLSDQATPTSAGPDQFGTWQIVGLRGLEVAAVVAAGYMVWRFVARPLIREHAIGFDGRLVIAGLSLWWLDPATVNYFKITFAYNAHHVNLGAWSNFIPGFQPAHGNLLPEPLLFIGGAYVWWIVGAALAGCAVLRRIRAKRPEMSHLHAFGMLMAILVVATLILEVVFIRTFRSYAYVGTVRWLTLWPDHWYQYPLYAPIGAAAFFVVATATRYFRNDRGLSWPERGIEELRVPPRAKNALQLLAVIGFMNFVAFPAYFGIYLSSSKAAQNFPPAPSYFRNTTCGAGDEYACRNSTCGAGYENACAQRP